MSFDKVNRFGLPEEFEEIDVNLNKLLFHVQPSQLHTLITIVQALTAPDESGDGGKGGTIPLHRLEMERSRAIEQDKQLEAIMQRSVILNDKLGIAHHRKKRHCRSNDCRRKR